MPSLALPRLRWPGALPGLLLLLALWLPAQVLAQPLQPVPPLSGRVIDQPGLLGDAQKAALEHKLELLEAEKGSQLVVLVVRSTAPEDIAAYAHRVADDWKIGRKNVGDGLLVLLAVEDRTVRVEVAKTLEGAVPDLAAKRIIDQAMIPHFRDGNYASGLLAGVDRLDALIRGEKLPEVGASGAGQGGLDWLDAAILLFFFTPILHAFLRQALGRKLGAVATGGASGLLLYLLSASLALALLAGLGVTLYALMAAAPVLQMPSGRSGPRPGPPRGGGLGSGLGGGGGFRSGGGGNFGGGGASGRW